MAPIHLAVDDTDSLDGMCTTYLATELIRELRNYDLIGLPRLVRLNPNVPWKTRGNAAICISLGRGRGRKALIGSIARRPVYAFDAGSCADEEEIMAIAMETVSRNAHFHCRKTNPGIVVARKRPSRGFYERAVKEIVEIESAEKVVKSVAGRFKKFKNGRGIIGAAAAMSWVPADRTFELLAYRRPEMIGKERRIGYRSVVRMAESFPSTFHNYDAETGHVAIAPGSPCPILFGIRGDSPGDLLAAKNLIGPERPERWLLFLTNQATDDHISAKSVGALRPREGAMIRGRVTSPAKVIPGGHAFFRVRDKTGEIECAVYEQAGDLRKAARALAPGDSVQLFGSIRETPFEMNVEKMRVTRIAREGMKVENPVCPKCGKHMKSIGKDAGYRCRKCGIKASSRQARFERRDPWLLGWHEPPIASRRHLYKPVGRFGIKRTPLRELLYMLPSDESSTS